jgi:hypothetical protein
MASYSLDVRAEYFDHDAGQWDNYRYVDTVRAVSPRHAITKAIANAETRFAYRFAHRIAPKWEVIFDAEILHSIN